MDAFTIADVSFWGPYTIIGTGICIVTLALFIWWSIVERDSDLFSLFTIPMMLTWFFGVGMAGLVGVGQEVERLKTEEMSRIGYENLTWNGDEFTGSKDGYYVVGFIKQHGDVYYVTDITRKGEMI